jgi:hypothetical protein
MQSDIWMKQRDDLKIEVFALGTGKLAMIKINLGTWPNQVQLWASFDQAETLRANLEQALYPESLPQPEDMVDTNGLNVIVLRMRQKTDES